MFALNNLKNVPHEDKFPGQPGESPAIFDMDENQLTKTHNLEWKKILPGCLVMVINRQNSHGLISNIHCADATTTAIVFDKKRNKYIKTDVLRGKLIATPLAKRKYTTVFKEYGVSSEQLQPRNWGFYISTNVANLGNQLNNLKVKALDYLIHPDIGPDRILTIGALKRCMADIREAARLEAVFPDEIKGSGPFWEGSVTRVAANAYERDPRARAACIEHYGCSCFICGFNFASQYGEAAKGIIHVHHLHEISKQNGRHQVDPVKDLRPVCPNCHVVLHHKDPAYTIQQVIEMLAEMQQRRDR